MKLSVGLPILIISAFVSSASLALAGGGGMEGGGGIGVRCGKKLELLDLHEARLRQQTLIQAPSSASRAIDLVANKMFKHFQWFTWESHETWVELYKIALVQPIYEGRDFLYTFKDLLTGDFEEVMAPVRYVSHLPLSKDIGAYKIAPGCHLEQIAYMTDGPSPKLEIVQSRWNELDQLSKAALVAHETFYHFERFNNLASLLQLGVNQTSESTRHFVGQLFSNQPPPRLMTDVPDNTQLIYCSAARDHESDPYTTFVVRENSSGFKAVFEDLHGANDLYQILANFKGMDFSKFTALVSEARLQSTIILNGSPYPTHLKVELVKQKNREEFQLNLFKTNNGKDEKIGMTRDIYCGTAE